MKITKSKLYLILLSLIPCMIFSACADASSGSDEEPQPEAPKEIVFDGHWDGKIPDNFTALTKEELNALVTFEDDTNGFKINYTTPEKLLNKYYINNLQVISYDANDNISTRQYMKTGKLNETIDGKYCVTREYSWTYPFVIPDKTYSFLIQFGFISSNDEDDKFDFQLKYTITTKHGFSEPQSLPKGFDSKKNCKLENGVFTTSIKDLLPTENNEISIYNIQKDLTVWGTNSDRYWDFDHSDCQWLANKTLDIDTEDPDSRYIVDLTKYSEIDTKGKEKVYCQFMYKFLIDGYDYCSFNSPELLTAIVPISNLKAANQQEPEDPDNSSQS